MRARLIIAAQAGIVIGLVGLALYQSRLLRQARSELRAALEVPTLPDSTNQRPLRLRLQQFPPINVRTQVRDLDWGSVESDDYVQYIENLRRIGCPEETIRDIIMADVGKLFEARRRAQEPEPADWDYWHAPDEDPEGPEAPEQVRQRRAREDVLEREKRELVTRLLGPEGAQAEFSKFKEAGLRDKSIQFLPGEKREAMAEAIARWRQALMEESAITDEDQRAERLAGVERQFNEEVAALLSPEEREQFELRASPLADQLREQLRGFGTTRQEFEGLYRLKKQVEAESASMANAGSADPQAGARLEALQMELESSVKSLLGPERYGDYQRSQDPDYQTLYKLASAHEVPTSVAKQVYDMRDVVAQQTERIRANPLLSPEQKQLALAAVRNETQSAIVDVLGEPLLEAYQQEGGGWLAELTTPSDLGPAFIPNLEAPTAPPGSTSQAFAIPEP